MKYLYSICIQFVFKLWISRILTYDNAILEVLDGDTYTMLMLYNASL